MSRCEEAWSGPYIDRASATQVIELAGQSPLFTAKLHEGEAPHLPVHQHHVLLCTSRRCTEDGAMEVYGALGQLLEERGLEPESAMHGLMARQKKYRDGDSGTNLAAPQPVIKLTRTRCLGPCAGATVACVYPQETFYWGLTPQLVPQFVEDVLADGGTMPGHTFRAGG